MNQQYHETILEMTHPSGADEWYCPIFGRRLLMKYGPIFRKTVLETGDEYATHSGGKDDLQMGSMRTKETALQEEATPPIDAPRLAPWMAWLDRVDFEGFWRDEDSQTWRDVCSIGSSCTKRIKKPSSHEC